MAVSRTITKGSARQMRSIRKKLQMSQAKLADALGVRTNTVARWERGDMTPPKLAELAARYLLLTIKPKEATKDASTRRKKG